MKNKINILMIGSDLSVKGGMTTVVNSFLNNKFNNIDIDYIATHIENVSPLDKIKFFIIALFRLIQTLTFEKIDIVHMHMSERGSFYRKLLVFIVSKFYNKKVILHLHGAEFKKFFYDSNKILKKMIVYLLKKSDEVIVLGMSWDKFIKSIDQSINTIILGNSVEYSEEKVKSNMKEINILFLSVLIERKGIFDLVDAAKILIEDNKLEDYMVKFIIAGTGKQEEEMKNKVGNLGLDRYFVFEGWVDGEKKKELIRKSQLFVLPSYNEGLPVAILEAMSYGMPIISTDVGSIKDIVIDNYNGFTIEPGNVNELALSIKKCIVNYDIWEVFSGNSKKIIMENYNIEKYFENIERIYTMLSV